MNRLKHLDNNEHYYVIDIDKLRSTGGQYVVATDNKHARWNHKSVAREIGTADRNI